MPTNQLAALRQQQPQAQHTHTQLQFHSLSRAQSAELPTHCKTELRVVTLSGFKYFYLEL